MAGNRRPVEAGDQPLSLVLHADHRCWLQHAMWTGQGIENGSGVMRAIGIERNGVMIATVVYSAHRHCDIEIGIHSIDKAWCNRRTLRAIFSYPFLQLGLQRVTATTDPANPAVCNFLKRIGFVEEGRLRQALPHGDILILGMTRPECRWV